MYEYKSPLDVGYKKVKVDKKKWNEVFPYKRDHFNWKQTIRVYYSKDKGLLIERYSTILAKMFVTLAYPFYILIVGLENNPQLNKEYFVLMGQKKYGGFSRDMIGKESKYYIKAVECITDWDIVKQIISEDHSRNL